MASSASIPARAFTLKLSIEAASAATWSGTAAVDESKLSDIAVSVDGEPVEFIGTYASGHYPYLNTSSNVIELDLVFADPFAMGAAVEVEIPAALVTDGTRFNAAETITVTNSTFSWTALSDIVDEDTDLFYVSSAGDDGTGAPVNYTGSEVGGTIAQIRDPDDVSSVAYETIAAALADASTGNFLILLERGTTHTGPNANPHYNMSTKGGSGLTTPAVVTSYGTGTQPEMAWNASNAAGTARMWQFRDAGYWFFEDVKLTTADYTGPGSAHAVYIALANSATIPTLGFRNCHFDNILGSAIQIQGLTGGTPTSGNLVDNLFIDRCVFEDIESSAINAAPPDPSFAVKRLTTARSLFLNCGSNTQDHDSYIKTIEEYLTLSCWTRGGSGLFSKGDTRHIGAHVRDVHLGTNGGYSIECNGNANYGTNDGLRTRSSPGGYCEKIDILQCLIAKTGFPLRLNCSRDIRIIDTLADVDDVAGGVGFTVQSRNGDSDYSDYATDSFDIELIHSTIRAGAHIGINLSVPTTDTVGDDGAIGWHGVEITSSIVFRGTTDTDPLLRMADADYVTARDQATSRCSCTLAGNCFWDPGAESGQFEINGTGYTLSGFETAMDGDASGNRFEDPGIAAFDVIIDYCTDVLGYTGTDDEKLDDFAANLKTALLSGGDVSPFLAQTIMQSKGSGAMATNLDADDYPSSVAPGLRDWWSETSESPAAASTPTCGRGRVGRARARRRSRGGSRRSRME